MPLIDRDKLRDIRRNWKRRNLSKDLPELLAHIDVLESMVGEGKITVNVGAIKATVDAGPDGKFGTKDDSVKLSRAKRKPAARKKAPAKKAAAKKPAAKKKS